MGRYRIETTLEADQHLLAYKKAGNKIAIERIERIFVELEEHPETGIGKPKKLKHKYSGYWSREIDKKNRMRYIIEENIVTVTVVSAMGHYDDK
jgi:toxin YoeB